MLTMGELKRLQPGAVIARGLTTDAPGGINMTGSGALLRWVAVRGQIHDWAIYTHHADYEEELLRRVGDKVTDMETIKRLVPCDDAAWLMYRG